MSVIKLTLPPGEIPVNGKQISFIAPCTCAVTDALQIEGVNYTVVDTLLNCVTGKGGLWDVGAVVSVVLDVDNKMAFIQGGGSGGNQPAISEITVQPAENRVTMDIYLSGGGRDRIVIAKDANGNPASITVNGGTPIPVTWGSWSGGSSKTYYNGVELPALPNWDGMPPPYQFIFRDNSNRYWLVGTTTAPFCSLVAGVELVTLSTDTIATAFNAVSGADSWGNAENLDLSAIGDGTALGYTFKPELVFIWTDTTIYKSNGTDVYLAKSEPQTEVS